MERPGAARALDVLFAFALAAVPAGLALAVRGLEPVDVDGSASWLPLAFVAALATVAAVAAVAALVPALRRGSAASLLRAGASAALASGAIVVLTGAGTLATPVLASAALLAGASLVGSRVIGDGRARLVVAAVAVMAVAEAAMLLTVIPATAAALAPLAPYLLGVAGALGALVVVRSSGRWSASAALFAAGALGLLLDRDGSIELVVGLAALVTSQLLALAAVSSSTPRDERDDRLPELAERLSEAVLRFDGHLRLRDWNAPASNLLGLDAASVGTRIDDLLGVALSDLPSADGIAVLRGRVGGLEVAMHRSGAGVIAVIRDGTGTPEVEQLGQELRSTIEELLRARRTIDLQRGELERSATVDPLTGISSRSAILERVRTEVAQARRYRHPLAVVMLDVDRFAEINEAYGIAGGDAVLREVALRVRLRVREADALGRSGSDGFLAALPHTDAAGASTFADALRIRLGLRPVRVGDSELNVTVSIGVAAMRPGEDLDLDSLLARVHEALDSARAAGGNRISVDPRHRPALDDAWEGGDDAEVS